MGLFDTDVRRWKATSDTEQRVSEVLQDRPPPKNKDLDLGDALVFSDGEVFVCTKAGYVTAPTWLYDTEAIVVSGRMKTPTELLG